MLIETVIVSSELSAGRTRVKLALPQRPMQSTLTHLAGSVNLLERPANETTTVSHTTCGDQCIYLFGITHEESTFHINSRLDVKVDGGVNSPPRVEHANLAVSESPFGLARLTLPGLDRHLTQFEKMRS